MAEALILGDDYPRAAARLPRSATLNLTEALIRAMMTQALLHGYVEAQC